MILYLIRHAQPCVNQYAGFPGPPLGDIGLRQAQNIANFLKQQNIEQIFTSDYIRVQQTLQAFHLVRPHIPITQSIALRERENQIESHESLVQRVENWFVQTVDTLPAQTAIFSHCGPINMILQYLDSQQTILDYPFCCPYLCLTPKGGIWELYLEGEKLVEGKLLGTNR